MESEASKDHPPQALHPWSRYQWCCANVWKVDSHSQAPPDLGTGPLSSLDSIPQNPENTKEGFFFHIPNSHTKKTLTPVILKWAMQDPVYFQIAAKQSFLS